MRACPISARVLVLNDPPNGHNAHLSDRVKTQMYLQHRKDPKTWDAAALAEHYKAGPPAAPAPAAQRPSPHASHLCYSYLRVCA